MQCARLESSSFAFLKGTRKRRKSTARWRECDVWGGLGRGQLFHTFKNAFTRRHRYSSSCGPPPPSLPSPPSRTPCPVSSIFLYFPNISSNSPPLLLVVVCYPNDLDGPTGQRWRVIIFMLVIYAALNPRCTSPVPIHRPFCYQYFLPK